MHQERHREHMSAPPAKPSHADFYMACLAKRSRCQTAQTYVTSGLSLAKNVQVKQPALLWRESLRLSRICRQAVGGEISATAWRYRCLCNCAVS